MQKITSICCAFLLLLTCLMAGCASQEPEPAADSRLQIVVSFNAIQELVQAVGKDKVHITTLIPDGTEPHDFQPTPKNIKVLHKADLFVYNGAGMEPWVKTVTKAASNKKLICVDTSEGIHLIRFTDLDTIVEHGSYDPHTWLSLANAQIQVRNIADALAKADAANADFYKKNATEYNLQLQAVLQQYQEKFAQVKQKDFVTGHAAFAYLCRDFNLTQTSVEDVFASGEPSARSLSRLADYCKAQHVTTIFVEEAVSPKTSQTLAKEVGAKTQTIHTIESSDEGKSYLERMQENLEAIYQSLRNS